MRPLEEFGPRKKGRKARSGPAAPRGASASSGGQLEVSAKELELARQIVALGLAAKSLRSGKASPRALAQSISALHLLDGYERERVYVVLAWYVAHHGERFVPKAYSGETLRLKYKSIVEAYERSVPDVVSAEARELAARVYSLGWPQTGLAQKLPGAAQKALDFVRHFRRAASERQRIVPPRGLDPTAEMLKVLVPMLTSEQHHVLCWFRDLHSRFAGWEAWDGDLSRDLPSLTNARYLDTIVNNVYRFSGRRAADAFDRFVEGLRNGRHPEQAR